MKELSPGRIETNGSFRLPRGADANLEPGTFTFLAEPGFQWGLVGLFTSVLGGGVLVLNMVLDVVFNFWPDAPHSLYVLTPTVVFVVALFVFLSCRELCRLRYPRAKFVFYQPGAGNRAQSYRELPIDPRPRYEVYFRGEVRESGVVTEKNLWSFGVVSAGTYNHSTRITTRGTLYLKSKLGDASPNDPSKVLLEGECYVLFRARDGYDLSRSSEIMNSLRLFLGLSPKDGLVHTTSSAEEFWAERDRVSRENREKWERKAGQFSPPSEQDRENARERSQERRDGLAKRLRMMRDED